MRFIGNKVLLVEDIKRFIGENIPVNDDFVFCDIFSGSGSVARYFKQHYKIISNDIMFFSYILQKSTIELNEIPDFSILKKKLAKNSLHEILNYLETKSLEFLQEEYNIYSKDLFIYNNYTPSENCERMYFTQEIGKRIDIIRIIIEQWLTCEWINDNEYTYLLALLIETVPYYSNISGVYAAYLKHWDPRALKRFKFAGLDIKNNHRENICYNEDSHSLIRKIEGDILYIDPPYNHRQYPPNYHILETVAKYDYPEINGVSGMRDYSNQISKFCRKREVKYALDDLIKNAQFQYIIMSYSTDGILDAEEIEEIFKKYGVEGTFNMASPIKYRKYKSKLKQKKKDLHELLFFVEKETKRSKDHNEVRNIIKKSKRKPFPVQSTFNIDGNASVFVYNHPSEQKNFLKCPFNYIGGKHKILPQLYEAFPDNISTFVDVFGGGFNVGINVDAEKIIYNDQLTPLVDLFKYFQTTTYEDTINYIESTIEEYGIKKHEKDGFLEFRDKYNANEIKNPLDLYVLICFSFNYQIRFNNSGEYNCPHGTNRSSFTPNMKERLKDFIELIHGKNIEFYNSDFTKLDYSQLDNNSLVYCDPPYLITTGSYNDGNRGFKNWTIKEEKELLELLNDLDAKGIHFALSNVTIHDGKENKLLIDWINKNNYRAIDISSDYSNSNYQKNKKDIKKNKEVLVVNY